MKTIREWLESIEDDTIREAAIRNAENNKIRNLERNEYTLYHAIFYAISFPDTIEGFDYWWDIYVQAKAGTLKTKEQ